METSLKRALAGIVSALIVTGTATIALTQTGVSADETTEPEVTTTAEETTVEETTTEGTTVEEDNIVEVIATVTAIEAGE